MIPEANITRWREKAPWITDEQVEQDLILSRVLVELFSDAYLSKQLAFRGGTALHKLFFNPPARYSEDIDLVRTTTGPITEIADAIRGKLDAWLGSPKIIRNHGRFTFKYRFEAEVPAATKMRIKIEINTREHEALFGVHAKEFILENPWFSGKANIQTYFLEELLGTKLRALFQRKKGRDLFDLAMALSVFPDLNIDNVMRSFEFYLAKEDNKITRAQFERNFHEKINDTAFIHDIDALLSSSVVFPIKFSRYEFNSDIAIVQIHENFISRIKGEAWKGKRKI